MIEIVNVTPDDQAHILEGPTPYEVRVNGKVICGFEHDRRVGALAQCLRDAADAVDESTMQRKEALFESIMNIVDMRKRG